jgi:hypothetical protein
MSPTVIGLSVFACVFGGALLGMALRRIAPDHHLDSKSQEVVKLGVGVIATMAALVLGLLIASAKTSFDNQNNALTEMSAKVILLDRILAHYGPRETKEIRDSLRAVVVRTIDQTWTADGSSSPRTEMAVSGTEGLYEQVQALSPQNDAQRTLQSQALSLMVDIGHTRWLMAEQQKSSVPTAFLVVLVLWLAFMFGTFGLFAPYNATVLVTMLLCALSISAAIFLILELYSPFHGVIQLSSAPLRYALAHLGQ